MMDTYNNISWFKAILSSDFGTWVWENQSDLLFFNATYMRMLGYEPTQFPFHISTWINLVHPEDRKRTAHKQQQMLENPACGDAFEDKFRMRTASGEYLWVLGRGFVLCRDKQGKALRVCGMHIEMNTLEKNLEAMAQEHDRMLFALEAANDGLWDWNPKTNEVYFSPRYLTMLGYTPEEFPASLESWAQKIHPDDLDKTLTAQIEFTKSPAHGDMFDCVYRFMDASGSYRWILGRGKITKRDENGHAIRVVGLHTDVTDLRETQEALKQLLHQDSLTHLYSRFYFDFVLNKVCKEDYPVSIIFCDLDGLKLVNDILGHTDGDTMLINAASILCHALPPNTIAARLGGDEFAVLLHNTTKEQTEEITVRIRQGLAEYNKLSEVVPIFLSMGIVTSEHTSSVYKLLSDADKVMLKNKQSQRKYSRHILLSYMERRLGQKINFLDARVSDSE